ncbi:MAG: DUF4339 domain-containing protein [Planctomycetota bacterium]
MSSQANLWYIRGEDNQPAGPFTTNELLQSLSAGRVDDNAICWREGMPQWIPLTQIEPFASAIRRAAVNSQDKTTQPSMRAHLSSVGRPFLPPRLLVPLTCVGVIGVLGILLAIALSLGRGGHFSKSGGGAGNRVRGDAAGVADVIANYATRLKQAYNSPQTDIQRQDAIAAAVEELKTSVEKCRTVSFTGTVAEIIPEGAKYSGSFNWETRSRWGISMNMPPEFEPLSRDGACIFGSKVWIELEKKDALSIQKGDPITIRGPVSYIQGSSLGATDCVAIQVWPNSKDSVTAGFGMRNLGIPHTIAVPVSKNVTCSVGRFNLLRVHTFLGE